MLDTSLLRPTELGIDIRLLPVIESVIIDLVSSIEVAPFSLMELYSITQPRELEPRFKVPDIDMLPATEMSLLNLVGAANWLSSRLSVYDSAESTLRLPTDTTDSGNVVRLPFRRVSPSTFKPPRKLAMSSTVRLEVVTIFSDTNQSTNVA